MPEPNEALVNLSIPELNNLFSIIGKSAYEKILKKTENLVLIGLMY